MLVCEGELQECLVRYVVEKHIKFLLTHRISSIGELLDGREYIDEGFQTISVYRIDWLRVLERGVRRSWIRRLLLVRRWVSWSDIIRRDFFQGRRRRRDKHLLRLDLGVNHDCFFMERRRRGYGTILDD